MGEQATHYLRNASRRPVEVHLADRVAVLLPRERLELGQEALASPAVRPLVAGGALTLHRLPEAPPPPPKPKPRAKRKAATAPSESLVARILKPRRKTRRVSPADPANPSSGPAEASGESE